jgi:hypothetical protein
MSTNSPQRYPLAVHSWKTSPGSLIVQCLYSGDIIGTFPLGFVLSSGIIPWTYIKSVVLHLVETQEHYPPVFRDDAGVIMEADDPVRPGVFTFEQIGTSGTLSGILANLRTALIVLGYESSVTMARGPEYFRSRVPPSAEGSVSTRSNSKRSSANQVKSLLLLQMSRRQASIGHTSPY